MPIQLDPEDSETTALLAYADFTNKRVLEIGCGDGRLTWRYAEQAAQVVAIDPAADRIEAAIKDTPEHLKDRVTFLVSGVEEYNLAEASPEQSRRVGQENSQSPLNPPRGFGKQDQSSQEGSASQTLAEGLRSIGNTSMQPPQGVSSANLAEGSRSSDGSHIQPPQGESQGFDLICLSWSLC